MQFLKSAIRCILRRTGYDINRYTKSLDDLNRPLDLLEMAVRYRLQLRPGRDFFFIQIGANDGMRADPLRSTVLDCHLAGLLVEPLPDMFEQLKRNYSSENQLKFENAAITRNNGEVSVFRFSPDSPVCDDAHGVASLNKQWLMQRAQGMGLADHVQEVKVPALTFASLIAKHGIAGADLLQVDTEGFDLEIIKMVFDAGFFPAIINFEYIHLSFDDRCESRSILAANGYRFIDGFRDTLAIRDSENRV
jgi:FkbM family methyltransferase